MDCIDDRDPTLEALQRYLLQQESHVLRRYLPGMNPDDYTGGVMASPRS
ncbi:hypothetical protein [Salipiger pallidus]|nr:hypothetical protein [Salipiger pallidus]